MSRRHHSRSPVRVTHSARKRTGHAVNMLDAAAVELARDGSSLSRKAERITCTIPGNRGDVRKRLTGGSREGADRRVSMRGSITKPVETHTNRRERRAAIMDRISYSNDSRRDRRHHDDDEDEDEDDRRNGSFRDSDKPVQRLIDPTFVPKSRNFFDHDDRMKNDAWRGRTVYDPRKDFGSRPNRRHSDWEGFGDRSRNRYERRDDRGRRDTYSDRRGGDFRSTAPRSGADGLWTHDKFMEIEDDSDLKKDDMEIVVDNRKSTRRVE